MHYVNDINRVPKMGQIITVQRPVSSAPINGLYVILDNSFAGEVIVQMMLEIYGLAWDKYNHVTALNQLIELCLIMNSVGL